mgnify:FL=1|jgi:DNA repair protein RecO (recombination protein O)
MAILHDTAICLRCWDFSETSQTVSLLTKDSGIIRGLAKGSRRDTGSFSGGFDPLTMGHIVARLKQTSDLATLTEWQLEHVWRSARNSLEVNRGAIYMVDLVGRMITDQDPHTHIFTALKEALDRMEDGHELDWPILRFQWALLVETGYQPTLTTNSEKVPVVAFCSRVGGVVEDTGEIDRVRVRKETIELLRLLQDDRPMQPVDPETLQRGNRLLAHYLRDIIGSESAAMRWMWGSLTP